MSVGRVSGISAQRAVQPLKFSMDQKIRKRAAEALSWEPKIPSKAPKVECYPLDVWHSLEQETDIQRLGAQFKAAVCDRLLSIFRNLTGAEQAVKESHDLMIGNARSYSNKVDHLAEDSLIELIELELPIFDDAIADDVAYRIGHFAYELPSSCLEADTLTDLLKDVLSVQCIDRAINAIGHFSEMGLEKNFDQLKNTLHSSFQDPRSHAKVTKVLSQLRYELLNSQLTAFIILASKKPQLLDKYYPYVQMTIPTTFHFLEALYAHAGLALYQTLLAHPDTKGFKDIDLGHAFETHSPNEIVKLIPFNKELVFWYLEKAIKTKVDPAVISYLLDEAFKQKTDEKEYRRSVAATFRLGIEHNLDIISLKRLLDEGEIEPTYRQLPLPEGRGLKGN